MNRQRVLVAAAVVGGALAALAPSVGSGATGAPSDPLGCTSSVFDPSGLLDSRVFSAIILAEQSLGADVRVRAERSVDGGLDARMDQLVAQCDGWAASDGELAEDMVVVLFSELEREASVYYGAELGPDLEYRWSDAVDEMTAEFPDDYSEGVVEALRTLRSGSSSETSTASFADTSSAAGPIIAVLVIGALILVGFISHVRREGWSMSSWADTFDDADSGGGWSWSSGSSRRRSSFSSSRSSSRSSGSSRSSSRGSRRAGGGTKKW